MKITSSCEFLTCKMSAISERHFLELFFYYKNMYSRTKINMLIRKTIQLKDTESETEYEKAVTIKDSDLDDGEEETNRSGVGGEVRQKEQQAACCSPQLVPVFLRLHQQQQEHITSLAVHHSMPRLIPPSFISPSNSTLSYTHALTNTFFFLFIFFFTELSFQAVLFLLPSPPLLDSVR